MFGWSENFRKITLPVHGLFVISIIFIRDHFHWSHPLIWFSMWFFISGLGVAIGYHRLLSHKAFTAPLFVKRLLAVLGCMAGQGSPIFWVATHRGRHHPHSDKKGDPHSPVHGRFHAFIGWQIHFSERDFSLRHATDLLRDPVVSFISRHYYLFYWFTFGAISWFFPESFLFGVIPGAIWNIHQENIVNLFCHLKGWGTRNFDLDDHSNNISWLALLTWGQALHNNHHKFPSHATFAHSKGEFDPCSLLIPFLVKEPTPATLSENYIRK